MVKIDKEEDFGKEILSIYSGYDNIEMFRDLRGNVKKRMGYVSLEFRVDICIGDKNLDVIGISMVFKFIKWVYLDNEGK